MKITQNALPAIWLELKRLVQQKLSLIGKEDLARLITKMEQLAVLLRGPFGYSTVQEQIETDIWVQVYQQERSGGKNRALPSFLKQGMLFTKITPIAV